MQGLLTGPIDNMMAELKNRMEVLLHPDNLEAITTDASFCMDYNKSLCDGLLIAAVNGRSEAIPELTRVLR